MKLYKNKSVTLDQSIMKIKFLLPFYLVLATITFCSRKASDDKEAASLKQETAIETTAADETTTADPDNKINGTLELDTATNIIYADIIMYVSNSDFKYANNYMSLQSGAYGGLALRYYDTVNNDPDNGPWTVPLTIQFSFPNTKNWKENDKIRVMSLNEEQQSVFTGLQPYFVARMAAFRDTPVTYPQLVSFNNQWNTNNPNNQVVTGSPTTKEDNKEVKGFIPRLTKDDTVLSLKRKR